MRGESPFPRSARAVAVILLTAACVLVPTSEAVAQDAVTVFAPEPIPEEYRSWSLFLICNPAWALPESDEQLEMLFRRFDAFGEAIGPGHAAVWFWSHPPEGRLSKSLDMLRSAAFCEKHGLLPSRSPHILFTTDYPGAGDLDAYPETFRDLSNSYVIELAGASADEITLLLTRLADRILVPDAPLPEPGSERFWRGWQGTFEAMRSGLGDIAEGVRVVIRTTFFTDEIDAGGSRPPPERD